MTRTNSWTELAKTGVAIPGEIHGSVFRILTACSENRLDISIRGTEKRSVHSLIRKSLVQRTLKAVSDCHLLVSLKHPEKAMHRPGNWLNRVVLTTVLDPLRSVVDHALGGWVWD